MVVYNHIPDLCKESTTLFSKNPTTAILLFSFRTKTLELRDLRASIIINHKLKPILVDHYKKTPLIAFFSMDKKSAKFPTAFDEYEPHYFVERNVYLVMRSVGHNAAITGLSTTSIYKDITWLRPSGAVIASRYPADVWLFPAIKRPFHLYILFTQ